MGLNKLWIMNRFFEVFTSVNDYELNGDELVMYDGYHNDENNNEISGYKSATYFKRQ